MKNTKPPCMCVHLLVYVSLEALINYSLGSRLLHTRQSYWILFTYSRKVPKSNVQNWGRFGKAWGSAPSIWNPLIYVCIWGIEWAKSNKGRRVGGAARPRPAVNEQERRKAQRCGWANSNHNKPENSISIISNDEDYLKTYVLPQRHL